MQYRIFPVTHYQQNCSLIWCDETRDAALIDPGGESERLLQQIDALGLELKMVLLTHGHIDHVAAAVEVASQRRVPIIGPHAEDSFWLEQLPQHSDEFGFPPTASFTPSRWLEHGEQVKLGHIALEVLHCPGHTPGHVVFYNREQAIVFVGDVLFQGSIGRSDFPRGDHQLLLQSIARHLLPLGDSVTVIPGHGPDTTIGEERRNNPFLQHLA